MLAIVLVGCAEHEPDAVGLPDTHETPVDPVGDPPTPAVDILFVVDNSGSMGEEQALLARAFPALIGPLAEAEVDLRVGITTTDNGNPVCGDTSPEAGRLQATSCRDRLSEFVFDGEPRRDVTAVACTDVCDLDDAALQILPTATAFDSTPRPRPWLESIGGVTNLPAGVDLVDAIGCFAPQGIAGCGFEAPLESMLKALLRARTPSESQYGFLRTEADLVVVIVTDEVDCSYAEAHASVFIPHDDPSDELGWKDPGGGRVPSAICWRAGVVCSGGPGTYDECHAANRDAAGDIDVPDDEAVLHPLSRYVELLGQIRDDKREIHPDRAVTLALIAGVPRGYGGDPHELVYADGTDARYLAEFGIGPGCVGGDGGAMAMPPVRERELAEMFAPRGGPDVFSICEDEFTAALAAIGDGITARLGLAS